MNTLVNVVGRLRELLDSQISISFTEHNAFMASSTAQDDQTAETKSGQKKSYFKQLNQEGLCVIPYG